MKNETSIQYEQDLINFIKLLKENTLPTDNSKKNGK